MHYILKEDSAEMIKSKYKNRYLVDKLDLSNTYVSLVVNRKKQIQKHMAYAFAKAIDKNLDVSDLFEEV